MTKQTPAPYFHIEDFVTIGNINYRVSTVDLTHGGTVFPANEYAWETMVFSKDKDNGWFGANVRYCRRYMSEAQASDCHAHIVERLIAGELALDRDGWE